MVFVLVLLMLLVNEVPFRSQANKVAAIKAMAIIFFILNLDQTMIRNEKLEVWRKNTKSITPTQK